ncbi:UNVERIFIED_CONTAM: hypothetical protein FKN15_035522 [Acipenser sinensis]
MSRLFQWLRCPPSPSLRSLRGSKDELNLNPDFEKDFWLTHCRKGGLASSLRRFFSK